MADPALRRAALYIRMSTDAQELSPAVQKQALNDYATRAALEVVESYEDDGRTGLTIKDRPQMRRLLADVGSRACGFDHVLVYDVSRWGRFQDTDASAYYEYHCRLHGVHVIYVKEPFENDSSPITALVKNLKRMMAAEYSRELKIKTRAGQELAMQRGFQMGRLPCIGFRRMSAPSDGSKGRELQYGERKPMLTDRVRWVLGPPDEVELVRRIFRMYTETNITIKGLVALLAREGARDSSGKAFTHQVLRSLLRCEAFAGAFVWGRREDRTGLIRRDGDDGYTRVKDVIEPIVERRVWELAQHKRRLGQCARRSREQALSDLKAALAKNPWLALTDLPGAGCPTEVVYRRYFGSFRTALRLAGQDEARASESLVQKFARGQRVSAAFRRDLDELIRVNELPLGRPPKSRVFAHGSGARMAVQIIWLRTGRHGRVWWLNKEGGDYSHVLLVRMEDSEWARDFVLLTARQYVEHPPWFTDPVIGAVRLGSAVDLVGSLRKLAVSEIYEKPNEAYRRLRYITPLPGSTRTGTESA
jgi:DNA invertase Pin-like site-specific DNA recombinase